jgi:hypothetical protein
MTTITKLEQQFKEGKPNGFKINLSDGTFGYLVEKGSDTGLKDGDEVTYTSETPAGKTYKKITVKKAFAPTGGQAPSLTPTPKIESPDTSSYRGAKSLSEMKFEGRLVCMKLAVECILKGIYKKDEAKEAFTEWVSVLDQSIDEIKPSR